MSQPRPTGQAAVVTLLTLAFSGVLAGASPGSEPQPSWAWLIGAALMAELAAPALGFGFLSLAFPYCLALASLSSGRWGVGLLWLALGLRTLARGAPSLTGRWLEGLADLFPGVLGLMACWLAHRQGWSLAGLAVASAGVYVFAWLTVPGLLAGGLGEAESQAWGVRDTLLPAAGALAGLGVLLALSQGAGLTVLVSLAIVAGLRSSTRMAAENHLVRVEREERREEDRRLTTQQKSVRQTQHAQERTRRDLEARLSNYDMVEKMLASLPNEPHLEKVVHSLLNQVRLRMPCRSVALLAHEQGGWLPLGALTPHADRLYSASLGSLNEPVLEKARHTRQPALEQGEGLPARIFLGEKTSLAVPLRSDLVLYVGNDEGSGYTPEQIDFVSAMANHAWLALEAARFFQAQQQSLEREAGTRAQMESLVQRLALVLDGVGDLVTHQVPASILSHAVALVPRLLPAQTLLLVRLEEQEACRPAEAGKELEELIATVCSQGRPLLLDDLSHSRFKSLQSRAQALLAVPVVIRQQIGGLIVVGGPSFHRDDMNILSVLAYQLGAAYSAARLFEDLEKAHEALKESQAQLIQSSKMAAIGQLAGGVAHELNTPLGAIALGIDGALTNLLTKPDRAEKRLTRAADSVQQMKEIVAKLLFYSRDARSTRRDTDINEVIRDTLQMIGNQFRLDNIEIETELAPLPVLHANSNELQQIFTNLLINARDAVLSPGARERRIRLTTRALSAAIEVEIQDWGCGMSQQVKERIFEPFYTTKEVGKGTGLGLSVTLELLEQHQGTLQVDSSAGQGTRFILNFPLNPGSDA